MNFISPDAIIEHANYKKDSEVSEFNAIPYKSLVADNFEQSMKKFISESTNKHYGSAYEDELKGNYIKKENYKPTTQNYFPTVKGINTGNKQYSATASKYQYVPAAIPNNNCGKKFEELIKNDNPRVEKGIAYPEIKKTIDSFTSNTKTIDINIVLIIVIIILVGICFKMYTKILKLKNKNKILKKSLNSLKYGNNDLL